MEEKYYTLKEAMKLTGICRGKIHKLCEQGYLEYIQLENGHRYIEKKSIYKLIEWQTEFKPIIGFPNYTISEYGEIRKITGKQAPRYMTPKIGFDGYYEVSLRDTDGKRHSVCVHRLVALTYIPNEFNLPQVNHIDENKLNNHISNLEWCSASYNCNYGSRNEKISKANKGKKRNCK